ncbi:MAG TPA: XRE family transcriptional regulator [Bacteroidetes bacterium]|nr:XRE family transcriptional regulator [Bacteroidota bacterium]
MASTLHKKLRERVTPEGQAFITMSVNIVKRVSLLMDEKGISKKQLADEMEKSPSEISKWLSGMHNSTIGSLAKLEVVLDASIISTETEQLTETETEILFQIRNNKSASLTLMKGVAYSLNPVGEPSSLFVREKEVEYKKGNMK